MWVFSKHPKLTSFKCQRLNKLKITKLASTVLEVTDNSWGELILDSKLPVALVEFWAPSCGPCKMMAPVMDELAKEYAGRVACFKINTDDSLSMASQYGVRSIPTVLLFKNGEQKESITGAVKKSALSATIEKHLDT
ncbi:uncharacterized protein A4U43_C04F29130 [Asparagus officinalis]|uniref:Thioredoxin domain-containing protein n=1 Tax=Asparagus officinalis TaxID=4686 RepID=A0A5P1F563_ASPOF|nr:uncharacterized protein A4U43_C04F29130 [Asparagus officinalis]